MEDNPADAKLIRLALGEARNPAFEVDWVRDVPDALRRLSLDGVDAILTDLSLPSSAGLDTLKTLQSAARGLPLVVLTRSDLESSLGQEAVQQGAQDYLDKKDLDGRVLARVLAFAIERKEIDRLREDFFQNINHELRTPLTVATGFLRCLLDDASGPSQAKQRRILEILMRNIGYMTQLVEEFVEATRAGTGKLVVSPRRTDLGALMVRTIEEFRIVAEERGLTLPARCPAGLPPALADPKRCRQILFNLIANAIKFTPRGGRVSLAALGTGPNARHAPAAMPSVGGCSCRIPWRPLRCTSGWWVGRRNPSWALSRRCTYRR
ncbi:MAG: response regulator [Elusimicrobia bacterium]|nr:response regulator [Elusimicrobiota bacterium]